MRIRGLIVIASLLPATMTAQRRPLPGTGQPPIYDPAPPSRQPEPIARAVSYQRMRLSLESYPLLGFVRTSAFTGTGASTWTTCRARRRTRGGGLRAVR